MQPTSRNMEIKQHKTGNDTIQRTPADPMIYYSVSQKISDNLTILKK